MSTEPENTSPAEPRKVVWPDIYLHTAQFERMRSLEKARTLLSGEPSSAGMGFVRSESPAPAVKDLIRLAHYINTGRDYRDRAELDKEPTA